MLEINGWLFVVMGLFLFLVLVLDRILFDPLLKVFDEREKAIDGSLADARRMDGEKDEAIATLKRERAQAAREAKDKYEALRAEGLQKQREQLEAAGAEAGRMIEAARASVRADSEAARGKLRAEVEKFSDEIVEKMI